MTMRLRHKGEAFHTPEQIPLSSIADAVRHECLNPNYLIDPDDEPVGRTEATARLLGRLAQQLHATGALSDAAVLDVLGGRFVVVGEDAG